MAAFNKRRFNARRATPEEQRVKIVNIQSA